MRSLLILPLLLCVPQKLSAEPAPHPVVLELFTSQGCSSCPPADELLAKWADQPGIIALSYHITYWDGLGWKDPYGMEGATSRQRAYSAARGKSSVYTPQLIVQGESDVVGSRSGDVKDAIKQASEAGSWQPVTLQKAVDGKLHIHLDASVGSSGDILLIGYQRAAETKVGRGENAGNTLTQRNNVSEIRPLQHWNGEALDLQELPVKGDGVAVIVQKMPYGPVIGGGKL